MKVTKDVFKGSCEECAFYNDCPYDYLCPPGRIVKFIQNEVEIGRIKIMLRKDLKKELDEMEEEE